MTTTLFLPPPPPHLSILKLWSNFILGLNFIIFFCLKPIFIHYHTQKPTYLGRNQPRLFWRLPPTVNSPNNPTTGRRNISRKQDPRVALCCSLVFVKNKLKKKVKNFEEEARLTRQYIVTVYQFHNKICFVLRSWTKLQKLISDKFCSISTLQMYHSN